MARSIRALVQDFTRGSEDAFAELVRLYKKKIYYLAHQILGNHLDADEVVQETFVRIYRKQQEIQHVKNFTSFVIKIATNYAIDLLRKQKGRGQLDDPSLLPGRVQVELARRIKTPSESYRDEEIMVEIWTALGTLPPRQKITAILHDVEGYSKSEVAAILGCPEATVRSNLHIARTKLRKILRKRLADRSK
ncbi:MAG: RNA polymerase sigma factor [Candidatus Zixiibacteriota bacterium]|nr:MAG: RNA polymerase sigma factor [candidate division Zixibacteria bacterium]